MPQGNKARQLYHILQDMRGQPEQKPVRENWAALFKFDASHANVHKTGRLIFELRKLIEQVEEGIKQYPDIDHELYLRHFENFKRVTVITNYDQPWKDAVTQHLNETAMESLEHCAQLFSMKGEDCPTISEADLAELQEEVLSLLEKVTEANIPLELKRILIAALEDISQAIRLYRLDGGDKLRRAYETNFLLIAYAQKIGESGEINEETNTILTAIGKVFENIYTHLATAAGTAAGISVIEAIRQIGSGNKP